MRLLAFGAAGFLFCAATAQAAQSDAPAVYYWGGAKVAVAPAADAPVANNACALAGLFEAEAVADRYTYPNALPGADTTQSSLRGTATVAANLNCGYWNFQAVVDGGKTLPFQYSFGNRGWKYDDSSFGGGGDIFWRDPSQFMIGAGLRKDFYAEHVEGFGLLSGTSFDYPGNFLTASAFGEYYLNDQVTLGMTGFYETGDDNDGLNHIDYQLRSYGGSAYARYYMTPNLRLSIRAIISHTDDLTANVRGDHWNAVASADYKFDDSPISVFGGLRYGGNDSNSGSSLVPNTFLEGFAGLRVALGAHADGTMLERDRNGVNLH